MVICDISKAFDRVWHQCILFKLQAAGVTGNLLSWSKSYLSNRRQEVVLPGASSTWNFIFAGVPQGSILGPLLFLLYINDIVINMGSNIRLFTDDTSIFIIVENPISAAQLLNSDLEKIAKWALDWLVTFNPIKTEALFISRKLQTFNHPPLFMLSQQIMEVDTHKHLGIYLSNDGSWHKQISYIKEKAWARINIMRRLKFVLDRKSLETIYISFIRPILDYGNEIWDNCQQYEKGELEKIQIEAARIATGTTKLVSIASLYREIGWNSLDTRRKMQKLVLFYKMVNHLTPLHLSSLIPPTVNETSQYNLRNANNISTIHARTNQYLNSFLPSTIRDWNSLSVEHRNFTSVASFKHTLNQTNISVPKYFYVGDRRPQVLHTCLRTKCSALNYKIYLKNLTDTPLCRCGNIENSEHFFLQCRYYHRQRLEMIQTISPLCHITLDVLLFGDSSLSMNTNTSIFTAVQKFIVETKRF